jgi:Xaa-Pro aminopeptidase
MSADAANLSSVRDSIALRRARIAAVVPLDDALLIVAAGDPVHLPENSDQTYPFRSHAEYYYLTGQECPGGILAYDPLDRRWISFVPAITEAEKIWEARAQLSGTPLPEFASWFRARRGRRVANLGALVAALGFDEELTTLVRDHFQHARRAKDAGELALMRRAVAATAAGFEKLCAALRPGISERALQIEIEAEFFRHGATRTGYDTIVGGGSNSAVLHFQPTARAVRAGEFVLVDAGAEVDRYVADVTRTFVVGRPNAFQRDLYQIVLAAQERAITRCVAGAEWKSLHLACATDLVDGLISVGVLRGKAHALIEQETHALFFPHGLGHLVGLGVRDASGLAIGRRQDHRPSLRMLRLDLPLQAGYVVTVEPGLYFIPPLLNDPARRARFHDSVNWPLVDQHLGLGGVRIEDNILVTGGAPENLTAAIPKTLA